MQNKLFFGGYMQNFDIEVEGHQVSQELLFASLRQYMNSVGGQNFAIHVEEKFTVAQQPHAVKVEDSHIPDAGTSA